MRQVTVAATQMACSWNRDENIANGERLVRQAAERGAQIILLQELFETPYFCIDMNPAHFALANEVASNPAVNHFRTLAKSLGVVLPISFFERAAKAYFNSLIVIDADGTVLDLYRKSHIPDSPGYYEKFYFNPGDTGFKVWRTKYADIGVAICWDQWFPESARAMAVQGAELIFYPTAIGSEPQDPRIDSSAHWQRVMQGHAAANMTPVIASNRVGTEKGDNWEITFYGSSFIADESGAKIAEAARTGEAVLVQSFDLDAIAQSRAAWGLYRDRRPDLYHPIITLDGKF